MPVVANPAVPKANANTKMYKMYKMMAAIVKTAVATALQISSFFALLEASYALS